MISDGKSMLSDYINIAGNYFFRDARPLDPETERLKSIDEEREGVRLTLHGGKHPFDEKKDDKKGETQQAQIDFVCDSERTGLEGLEGGEEKLKVKRRPESNKQYGTADDDKDDKDDKGDKDDGSDDPKSLRFISYGHQEGTKSQVLKLEWRTKYACEDFEDGNGGDGPGNHWGFFTWLIVLYVICIREHHISTLSGSLTLTRPFTTIGSSSARLLTLFSALGLTTTAMVPAAGICYRMATRSATYPTS